MRCRFAPVVHRHRRGRVAHLTREGESAHERDIWKQHKAMPAEVAEVRGEVVEEMAHKRVMQVANFMITQLRSQRSSSPTPARASDLAREDGCSASRHRRNIISGCAWRCQAAQCFPEPQGSGSHQNEPVSRLLAGRQRR